VILEKLGDPTGALVALDESLRRDPESIYTLNNKGNVLMDLDRLDEALSCFDAIIERTAAYPLAYYNRACVFARRGKVQEAVRELAKASAQEAQFLADALQDPDFEGIRDKASFMRLLNRRKAG
jgi:tetratricopeptide (TPR) repeat protein